MGFRIVKPRRFFVQRDVQMLVRAFPSESVTITRARRTYSSGGQQRLVYDPIFMGEALVVPATGDVQDFGLGQVENKHPKILIAGTRDIQQGDFVLLAGRRYQVMFEPNAWHGFTLLNLAQWEQGS